MSNEATREQARQILKKGILDMNIARLIQMSQFGLMGNISLSRNNIAVKNGFNHIDYDDEYDIMTFSVQQMEGTYGEISIYIGAITEISGGEDKENPDEYLNINIILKDETQIKIKVLY